MSSKEQVHPSGYLANQDRGPPFLVYNIFMILISFFSVVIRFYSRATSPTTSVNGSRFWWDDWVALAALPLTIAVQTLAIIMIGYGMGKHVWNVPTGDIGTLPKLIVAVEMLFPPSAAIAKASALLFYQRVFDLRFCPRWFTYGIYLTHAANFCWWIAADLSLIFMCNPPSKQWRLDEPGHCGKISMYMLGGYIVPAICIDLLILLLPLPLIWRLHLNQAQKIGLTLVFMFGYSVIAITVGSLVAMLRLNTGLDADFSYDGVTVFYWFGAEVPTTLLSACLPVLSPLVHRLFRKMGSLAYKLNSRLSFTDRRLANKLQNMADSDVDEHEKPNQRESYRKSLAFRLPSLSLKSSTLHWSAIFHSSRSGGGTNGSSNAASHRVSALSHSEWNRIMVERAVDISTEDRAT